MLQFTSEQAISIVCVVLMQVFMIARGRAAASASAVVRTLAGRDEEAWKLAIREREILHVTSLPLRSLAQGSRSAGRPFNVFCERRSP
jgi:hypothetical protein